MDSHQTNRPFPSFPVPATGETIFSVFARCRATSGFPTGLIVRTLTNQKRVSALRTPLPLYLQVMAANIHHKHPFSNPLEVIRNHSLFPYLTHFMLGSKRAELEAKLASDDVTPSLWLRMGLLRYTTKITAPPRFCPSCIAEGINSEGFPYYRLEHQLPGVFFCWRHQQVLYHGCERCGEYPLQKNSLTLAGQCNCSTGIKPLRAVSHQGSPPNSLLWLAQQSAMLLGSSGTSFTNPALALGREAAARAANRLNTACSRSIAMKIMEFFGEEALKLLNIDVFVDGEAAPWIRRFSHPDRGQRSTIHYLLMVGAHFDSVKMFEESGSEELQIRGSKGTVKTVKESLVHKHRTILHQVLAEKPEISRGEFQLKHAGSYDFLIRYDKAYFQSKILRKKMRPSIPCPKIDWAALDNVKASQLLQELQKEQSGNDKPVLISETSALRSINIYEKFRKTPSHFPAVKAILDNHLEDRDSYHMRRLRWAVTKMKQTGTPISANRLRRVAALELKVLHRHRDFILATVEELGAVIDEMSFLTRAAWSTIPAEIVVYTSGT